jgi:hypothetical protein
VTSDAGVLLLRQVDHHLGLLANVASRLPIPALRSAVGTPSCTCCGSGGLGSARAVGAVSGA